MKQIYIHGLGQTKDSWEKTLKKLTGMKYSECPNLAEIVHKEETTYENLYIAFSNICNKYKEPIDLCGLSLGGVLALNYAIDYPNKINSLVLIATQYKMPKRLLQFQNLIFRFMPKSMFQQMGFKKAEFLQLCRTMMSLDFSKLLIKISCPTLIICGEKDSANKNASVKMADMIGNAKLQIVNGVGHEINVEAPEKLAKILENFYSEVR